MDAELRIVYVTVSGKEEAERIAKELVSRKLAACVNIYDGVTSIYRWEGKEQKDTEATLFIKTKNSLLPEIKKTVKELHSYSCPCVVAVPIVYSDEEYAKWVMNETK